MKQVVSKEEATASAEAGKVKAIKDECEGDLAEAMPLLEVSAPCGVMRCVSDPAHPQPILLIVSTLILLLAMTSPSSHPRRL